MRFIAHSLPGRTELLLPKVSPYRGTSLRPQRWVSELVPCWLRNWMIPPIKKYTGRIALLSCNPLTTKVDAFKSSWQIVFKLSGIALNLASGTMWKNVSQDDPELKRTMVNAVDINERNDILKRLTYFSDWYRLKAAIAWLLRFKAKNNCKLWS